ncbi:MAG: tetratricopeptide repeat protein [Candidatus Schekmanbacteria bacterium]|nr:tetratricopeptide repeat protein [Candidatus Schekmanbacteria bacterium]
MKKLPYWIRVSVAVCCCFLALGCGRRLKKAVQHYQTGRDYFDRGELQKAVDELELAIHQEPDLAPAHHALGLTYIYLNKPAVAVSYLQRALEIDSRDVAARLDLAELYRKQGLHQQAVQENLRILFYNSGVPQAARNLGVIYANNLYHFRYARYYLTRYLELEPDAPDKAQIEQWIAVIEQRLVDQREEQQKREELRPPDAPPMRLSAAPKVSPQ